jgi:hypothetical protein
VDWWESGRVIAAEDNYFKIEGPSLGEIEGVNRGTTQLYPSF